jgi:hypothetical protein
MSFATALSILRPTLPYYLAVTKFDLLHITPNSFEYRPHPAAPPVAIDMVQTVFAMGASACIETLVMSRTLAEGPKIFTFDALTCEALENFDLGISTTDYQQPFPSVVIELPLDYTRERVVPFDAGQHSPDFVIVRHEPAGNCIMIAMHMTSHQVLTRLLKLDPTWTLEEMWAKGQRSWDAKDSLEMTPEEKVLGSALSKMALNVCLMATAYGVECLGPANPSHYERLRRHVKVAAKKDREQKERAESELRTAPVRYAFAQEITLFHRETAEADSGRGGWTVTPHWRKGHWRWQPCGPGRSERRRIAIPSVLVNGHRMAVS